MTRFLSCRQASAMNNNRTYLMLAALAVLAITAFMESSLAKSLLLLGVGIVLIADIIRVVIKRRKENPAAHKKDPS